ncbi:MAG TPA: ubiquinol-cytochrome c reductase iron-sulfur subunit [Dissulfurispiraceae bacterium]
MESVPDDTGKSEASRRGFLKRFIGAAAAISGLILGLPLIRAIVNSSPSDTLGWTKAGDISSLPVGQPRSMRFTIYATDAYLHKEVVNTVWVVKKSRDEFMVFSPICPHLGCRYDWDPRTDHFACPCHASVFTITGQVVGGPAPRPLDTLPYKVENGILYVQWERFQVGIPQKVRV